ncbi:MAG: hypothetical protein ACM3ML_33045, partial [Micromonosporaceae bacterium]
MSYEETPVRADSSCSLRATAKWRAPGLADRSEAAGGFVEPQVLPGFRRQGIGGVLLRALAD